jgi:hypothetical protein
MLSGKCLGKDNPRLSGQIDKAASVMASLAAATGSKRVPVMTYWWSAPGCDVQVAGPSRPRVPGNLDVAEPLWRELQSPCCVCKGSIRTCRQQSDDGRLSRRVYANRHCHSGDVLSSTPTLAGDFTEGKALAELNCSRCEALGSAGNSPFKEAPPFRTNGIQPCLSG